MRSFARIFLLLITLLFQGIALAQQGYISDVQAEKDLKYYAVSYTHLRAHETVLDLVCRLLLEKKNKKEKKKIKKKHII